MGHLRSIALAVVVTLAAAVAATACSSGGDAKSTTTPPVTICNPKGTAQPVKDMPQVANIAVAIAQLERQLGAKQEYFEVNATARVVNLFVALNKGTMAQTWVWVDGTLTSKQGQKASGGTFTAAQLDYQPDKVLSQIRGQIPEAILESFYVNGDSKGNVQYGVLTSAQCGGGLDIIVGPDGKVKSVDPVQ
ncbi:MAG: hypothetical protein WCI22_13605 [Actinomycetota bacterium]